MLIDKKNQEMFIIDVVILGNFRVGNKEAENTLKYQDLALKISQMVLKTKTTVIPIVIGAFGAHSLLTEYLALIG